MKKRKGKGEQGLIGSRGTDIMGQFYAKSGLTKPVPPPTMICKRRNFL